MAGEYLHQYIKYLLRLSRHYLISDKKYRIRKFKKDFGFHPNLSHPKTFNEKILFRMINPIKEDTLTQLADKLEARKHVAKINKNILTFIYGIYKSPSDINIQKLPRRFVLKCNHDTGSSVICEDKESFDFEEASSKLYFHTKMNMYYKTREWQYKRIKPLIFCEEYVEPHIVVQTGIILNIFRFHCFDSTVLYVEVECTDSLKNHYTNIYDRKWNILKISLNDRENTPSAIPEPVKFDEAVTVAESLSKGMDYVRIDLYVTSTKIYFSEFTFSPNNGREKFLPYEWDTIFGKNWDLDITNHSILKEE